MGVVKDHNIWRLQQGTQMKITRYEWLSVQAKGIKSHKSRSLIAGLWKAFNL